jgi:transposase-like protein
VNLNEIPFDASTGAKQRCWFHAAANVLNARPRSVQPAARRALAEIRDAEDKAHAQAAIKAFAEVSDRPDALLAFYDMPAEHWVHLKTTNPSRPSPRWGCAPR